MNEIAEDWRRLGTLVHERRILLGLTQQDIRSLGGPSTATMRLIEGALQTSYRPMVLSGLEKALQWAPGSIDAILSGGSPIPIRTVQGAATVGPIATTAHATGTAYPPAGRAPASDPVVQLLDERRGQRAVPEAAAAAHMSPERWGDVIAGARPAHASELARMAHAVGVQSFELRKLGRADVADALQDLEIEEAHGGKGQEQLVAEAEEIYEEIMDVIRRRGLDRSSRQMRVVQRFLKAAAETLAEGELKNNAS